MKRVILATAVVALLMATRAAAQSAEPMDPPDLAMAVDTPPPGGPPLGPGMGPGPMMGDPRRMQALRAAIEQRWDRMVQQELQLSDQQMDRVRTATRAHQDRRRDLLRRRVDLERGIQRQMQPGVAANNDSLNRMLEGMGRLRVEDAQSDEQLNRDLTFLTPVQRARFFMMQRRFEERLHQIRQRMGGPGAPGMRPGMQPGMRQPAPGAAQPRRMDEL